MTNDSTYDDLIQEIKELREKVLSCVGPVTFFLNDAEDRDHSAAVEQELSKLKQAIQQLYETSSRDQRGVADAPPQPESIRLNPKPMSDGPPVLKAKPAKVATFFLLYIVFRYSDLTKAVSQKAMFDLLCEFDPSQQPKRPSFNSRLSDLRKKEFLWWVDSEDIKMGNPGVKEMQRLLRIAMSNPEIEEVRTILQQHFGGTIDFEDVLSTKTS